MSDRSEHGGSPLQGARDASIEVDAETFVELLDGWTELEAAGEVRGSLLLVRVGSGVPASTLVTYLAGLGEPIDVLGPIDPFVAGALIDAPRQAIDDLAIRLHAALGDHFVDAVWVAAVPVGDPSSVPVLDRGWVAHASTREHRQGSVVRFDGSILEP